MNQQEVRVAGKLLNKSVTAVYALLRVATAGGLPRTLEAIAGLTSPLAELGYMALAGRLELTSVGKEQLQAWKARHNIEG